MDGLWSGGANILQSRDEDPTEWYRDAGTNGSPKEPRVPGELQANILNFTLLCGVALSDQLEDGAGQLGLLHGAHHVIEQVYQRQAERGGPVGPGGPGWPREHTEAPNGHGLRYYPDEVREHFHRQAAAVTTVDGRLWPRPDIVRLSKGDGVLVLHEVCPHVCSQGRRGADEAAASSGQKWEVQLCSCWRSGWFSFLSPSLPLLNARRARSARTRPHVAALSSELRLATKCTFGSTAPTGPPASRAPSPRRLWTSGESSMGCEKWWWRLQQPRRATLRCRRRRRRDSRRGYSG